MLVRRKAYVLIKIKFRIFVRNVFFFASFAFQRNACHILPVFLLDEEGIGCILHMRFVLMPISHLSFAA